MQAPFAYVCVCVWGGGGDSYTAVVNSSLPSEHLLWMALQSRMSTASFAACMAWPSTMMLVRLEIDPAKSSKIM